MNVINIKTISQIVVNYVEKTEFVFYPSVEYKAWSWRKFGFVTKKIDPFYANPNNIYWSKFPAYEITIDGQLFTKYMLIENELYLRAEVRIYLCNDKPEKLYFDTDEQAKNYVNMLMNEQNNRHNFWTIQS